MIFRSVIFPIYPWILGRRNGPTSEYRRLVPSRDCICVVLHMRVLYVSDGGSASELPGHRVSALLSSTNGPLCTLRPWLFAGTVAHTFKCLIKRHQSHRLGLNVGVGRTFALMELL